MYMLYEEEMIDFITLNLFNINILGSSTFNHYFVLAPTVKGL